jgi:glycogen operon protein
MNAFRRSRNGTTNGDEVSLNELLREARITWHGVTLNQPDWGDASHTLAFTRNLEGGFLLHAMISAYWEPLTFALPPVPGSGPRSWRRCIDTALPSPGDMSLWADAPEVRAGSYVVQPRSVVVLVLAGGDQTALGRKRT